MSNSDKLSTKVVKKPMTGEVLKASDLVMASTKISHRVWKSKVYTPKKFMELFNEAEENIFPCENTHKYTVDRLNCKVVTLESPSKDRDAVFFMAVMVMPGNLYFITWATDRVSGGGEFASNNQVDQTFADLLK